MNNKKIYCIVLVLLLIVNFGITSQLLRGFLNGGVKRDKLSANEQNLLNNKLTNTINIASDSVSTDVPLAYIGSPKASWAILFYTPSQRKFTFRYRIRHSGAYYEDDIIDSAITGFFVAFSLYYDDTGEILTDNQGNYIRYKKTTQYSIDEKIEFFLSSEPRWDHLKWNIIGAMWGKTWDAVNAEMQSAQLDWWYNLYQMADAILLIAGLAMLVIETGGTAAGVVAAIPQIIDFFTIDMIENMVQGQAVQWIYEALKNELESRAQKGFWSTVLLGINNHVKKNSQIQVSIFGKEDGDDTRDTWELRKGAYETGQYTVNVRAYRVNKLKINFTTPKGGSEITGSSIEGDPYYFPYHDSHQTFYQKYAVSMSISDQFYKIMKHDDNGAPYVELSMHVIVDYEISSPSENYDDYDDFNPSQYTEGQPFTVFVTGWGVGATQVESKTTETTKNVKIHFVLFPSARKAFMLAVICAVAPLYIIYEKVQAIQIVIPYPPYKSPKYWLIHSPHAPGLEDFKAIYVGPKPPPRNVIIDLPNPNYRYIIWIPQIPGGNDWKATLAYDFSHPFYYGQVVSISDNIMENYKIAVKVPALDKEVIINPPTIDEVLATTVYSPSNMEFIVPVLPSEGERKVIDISNPDEALLVTAQTTSEYPLKISLNDIPRTTYVKIKSSGTLDLRILEPESSPSSTISDDQLGIYVQPGVSSSYFEFYFSSQKVVHGNLQVPPSVTYSIDYSGSGLSFSEDDDFPKISATLQDKISATIQLVGHGVDLSYSHRTGTKNYKITVKNIGVVQDTYNLSIIEKPSFVSATLGEDQVTLNPGETAEVDLYVNFSKGQEYPSMMIGPSTTSFMMGLNDGLHPLSYSIKVEAVCNAKPEVYDTVKVPIGVATPFLAEVTLGNKAINTSLLFKNTFIKLEGNLTVEDGGSLQLENSTVIANPDEGSCISITILEGGRVSLNDSTITSKAEENLWEFNIRGDIEVIGKAKIRDSRINLLNNLELVSGCRLILSNSEVKVGESGSTPEIRVYQGGVLSLLNSNVQSFDPSSPFHIMGGGEILKIDSNLRNFLSSNITINTFSHSLHIRYPEVAEYPIEITNTGNETDQILLHIEKYPETSEWAAELEQTVFILNSGETASTLLRVWPQVQTPIIPIVEVDVIGESSNDPEVSYRLKTFTKAVGPHSQPYIDIDEYDTYLTNKKPIEGETVKISSVIHNDGDQNAYNVNVTFFDQTASEVIATINIPEVPARNFVIVESQWYIKSASEHVVETTVDYLEGIESTTTNFTIKTRPLGDLYLVIDEDPPLVAYTGQPIYFDAFNFTDVDGNIVEFLWDFGDGAHASGPLIVYSYSDNGTYNVTLRVIDDFGAEITRSIELTILNRPPVASFTASPESTRPFEPITFNATASYDVDGNIIAFLWDFGDGNSTEGTVVVHEYKDEGAYNVSLTVIDDDGQNSTYQITVNISLETIIYDVGITEITLPKDNLTPGENIEINVTAINFGNLISPSQTFNVSLYLIYNGTQTLIGKKTITLDATETVILSFNRTFPEAGIYLIKAVADPVPNEENLKNNIYTIYAPIGISMSGGASTRKLLQ